MFEASSTAIVLDLIRAKSPKIKIGEIAFNIAQDAITLQRRGIEVEETELIVDGLVRDGALIQCEPPTHMFYLLTEKGHRRIYSDPF
jgi:predicted transcriptional regulator